MLGLGVMRSVPLSRDRTLGVSTALERTQTNISRHCTIYLQVMRLVDPSSDSSDFQLTSGKCMHAFVHSLIHELK